MSDLEFIAFSDDGSYIILQNGSGEWIEVPIKKPYTPTPPTPTLENLSAREIQFRIRAGLDPQTLANQTGTDLDRIMIFAPPVLHERSYVAHKASTTIIRKASGTGPLLDVVLARLSPLSIDETDLAWDACRREDGRWNVTLTYPSKDAFRKATWLYDARNSALVPSDEEARWLMGESSQKAPAVTPTQPTEFIKIDQTPHLKVVPSQPEFMEDELAESDLPQSVTTDADHSNDHPTEPHLGKTLVESESEESFAATETDETSDEAADEIGLVNKPTPKPGATLFDTLTENEDETEGVQRPKLPSWDEILFGSRKKD